jgi:hypothetical protein
MTDRQGTGGPPPLKQMSQASATWKRVDSREVAVFRLEIKDKLWVCAACPVNVRSAAEDALTSLA